MDKQPKQQSEQQPSLQISKSAFNRVKDASTNLFSALFPSRCILCHQTISDAALNPHIEICSPCLEIQPLNEYSCSRCALPLPLPENLTQEPLCGRCIRCLPKYDYVKSLYCYEGEVINLVHQLKFSEKISYARSIGELLLAELDKTDLPDCFLPVPLHSSRLQQRGYNQSIEISRVLSKKTGVRIEYDAISRLRSTQTQTGLDAKQRQKNIRDAFAMADRIEAEHVLIVDDVMTTGATVNELAHLLKRQGVKRVGVLCIARAPLKN